DPVEGARRQGRVERGFQVVSRRKAGGRNRSLLGIAPVVVDHRGETTWTVQFQSRIRHRIGNPETADRWPERPEEDMLGCASGDNESANADAIAGLNKHSR